MPVNRQIEYYRPHKANGKITSASVFSISYNTGCNRGVGIAHTSQMNSELALPVAQSEVLLAGTEEATLARGCILFCNAAA